MSKKYVIIGAGLTGTLLALEIRKLDKKAQIYVYDKEETDFMDPSNYNNWDYFEYLYQETKKSNNLISYNPKYFKEKYDINVQLGTSTYQIDDQNQEVLFRKIWGSQIIKQDYNYLIICKELKADFSLLPYGFHSVPPLKNFYLIRTQDEIKWLIEYFNKKNIKDVLVVPGNLLGIKVAKSLSLANKNVSLVQIGYPTLTKLNYQILDALDYDMAQMINKDLIDHNVKLILKDYISEFYDDKVKLLISDKEIKTQAIVYTNISLPNLNNLASEDNVLLYDYKNYNKNNKTKKLAIYNDKQIIVDKNYKTNLKNVYAIGNCIKLPNCIIDTEEAQLQINTIKKQINDLLNHIFKKQIKPNKIITQTSHFKLFDFNVCYTGLNKRECNSLKINYKTAHVIPTNNSDDILKQQPIHFQLIFENKTKKILGAQVISKVDVKSKVDVITKMINNNATLDDLKKYCKEHKLENDVLGTVVEVALNISNNQFNQIEVTWVRDLVESNQFILDVRSKEAYNKAHIINAINIPFDELEQRYDEIPKDKPVYIHCRTSRSSYKAIKLLEKIGFNNLINIQGSFLQLSYFEYFNDKTTNRKKVLTDYNFE
ncbi:Coenzyme A disulfide reductase [Mycoplasma mycoides subsp. capri LC str. 95010]|uniref:Coenzyme A disulfide reductase n=1 Tax=Mycoplasma mycoides subsp. capri LC str. 95010 TaxID=862259 RepID=F4MPV1_MYCML|nr:rhodanese-like domain-containing protein [Mycoplasma mycoides]CBW54134.1 Coenzyme A disulfide reductase [Mycoplasma mycoides subsp. capri LC str. 95010]